MEKGKLTQISRKITKSLQSWDIKKAIDNSKNETQTRDYLIEIFFNILGYDKYDYNHEYSLHIEKGKVKKVDMAIRVGGKKSPDILIECKKATQNLTENHYNQLAEYYNFHDDSKIGILTNGIVYKFFCRSLSNKKKLHKNPFIEFDLSNYDSLDVEKLVSFYKTTIDLNQILHDSEEVYFLDNFNNGLFKTLNKPTKDFIKLVYTNMGGGRMTDKINERIYSLINSISLSEVVEKIKISESKDSKDGVLTTAEELKSINIIRTIIAMTSKINNNEIDRIGYRDYKGHFKIIVDNMPTKEICYLKLSNIRKSIVVNKEEFVLDDVSAKSITKYRRQIVDSAIKQFKK
tara:strand:+ start:216 stop:1256 length:1041 start_codon:yes stop_codon:yes gene_type:complete